MARVTSLPGTNSVGRVRANDRHHGGHSPVHAQAEADAAKLLADTKEQAEAVVQSTQDKLKELRNVTNSYVIDALKRTEEAVAEALKEVETAREKFEALSNPEPKEESPIVEEV